MDDDQIFRQRVNQKIPYSEARAIMVLLGFDGVNDFAARSGINHETAGAILGTCKPRYKKHHYNIVTVNESLHTAYMERREELTAATRRYICDWAKRWKKHVIENVLFVESEGKLKEDIGRQGLRQRMMLRKKVRAGVLAAFAALEWK